MRVLSKRPTSAIVVLLCGGIVVLQAVGFAAERMHLMADEVVDVDCVGPGISTDELHEVAGLVILKARPQQHHHLLYPRFHWIYARGQSVLLLEVHLVPAGAVNAAIFQPSRDVGLPQTALFA